MNAPWGALTSAERVRWLAERGRFGVPALIAVGCALVVTLPVPGAMPVLPPLTLLVVIAWGLYRPTLMPPWAALVAGVAADLAGGLPLGINATLMPAVALLLRESAGWLGARRLVTDWLLAGAIVALYAAAGWWMLGTATRDPTPLVAQTLIGCALFPAVAHASAWVDGKLA